MNNKKKERVVFKSRKTIPVHMEETTWRNLRKLSHLSELSMNELAREGIEIILNNNKNILTNSDIVIS